MEVSFRLCQAPPGFSLMQTTSSSVLLLVLRSPAWGFLDHEALARSFPLKGKRIRSLMDRRR